MPKHTVAGKRQIIAMALKAMGEKQLTTWAKSKGFSSIKEMNEKIRQKKASFFRELYDLHLTYL